MTRPYRLPIGADTFDWFANFTKKQCSGCGRLFLGRGSAWAAPYYCSDECRQDARRLRRETKRRLARKVRERELEGKFTCADCDTEIMFPSRTSRRYCSNSCRQRAYRRRSP
jgi:hypothetical protein